MMSLFRKVRRRIYADEVLLLFEHKHYSEQISPASIKIADKINISDVLFFDSAEKLQLYRKYLGKGDACYLAYLDGACVHRSWVIHKPQPVWLHWALKMVLTKDEAYIHFCETAETARGKNVFTHVLCRIASDYKSFNKIYISVNQKNKSSIKSIEKSGFIAVKRIRIFALMNIRIYKQEIPIK